MLKMEAVKSFICCDRTNVAVWRFAGVWIGWFSLVGSTWLMCEVLRTPAEQSTIVSIIYTILVVFLVIKQSLCKYVTLGLCVAHCLSCIVWLFGIKTKKTEFMLASLMWWGAEVGFFLCSFIIFVFIFGLHISDYSKWELEHICLIISSVIFMTFYVIAVISYKSIEDEVNVIPPEVPFVNVLYSVLSVDSQQHFKQLETT